MVALLCFSVVAKASAQDTAARSLPYTIFVMPCQLLPLAYSGGLTVGTEFPLVKQLSLSAEGGLFYEPGYMVKVNLKYYLPHSVNEDDKYYLALEYSYKKQRYTVSDNIKDSSGSPGPEVSYSVYKFANTLSVKLGCLMLKSRVFFIDGYCGLGLRYKAVGNSLAPGDVQTLYHWNEGFIDNFSNSAGSGFVPTLSLGIKLGVRYK